MLRFLSIRNLAVIDRLELEFASGLNVLTGETGAGKSILVGAVGLLAGGRGSSDLVRSGEDAAIVEAAFETAAGSEIIVRREISAASGRSRSFLDGALVSSTALREAAGPLVDLHGQHEHQRLLDPGTHLELLDMFAELSSDRALVGERFGRYQQLRSAQQALAARGRDARDRADFLAFQLEEIRRAAPRAGEDEELDAERRVLANADRLQRLCTDAYTLLYEGEGAAIPTLSAAWKKVADLAAIDAQFAPHLEARDTIRPALEDLAFFLRSYAAGIDATPARLQQVEDRLDALERLKKKHGPLLADVLRRGDELARELDALDTSEARAAALDKELASAAAEYLDAAGRISERRRLAAADFSRRLERSLADLAMARTRCEVRFAPADGPAAWSERGLDEGEFYISPNEGEEVRPLARIASGGELSRIMLALKTLAPTDAPGKTLVFDEVDAGIGGTVADIVGSRLRALGEQYQVLCITHLPQIAAYGTTHFRIAKEVKDGRTVTGVDRLSPRDRELELARMIAGADVSASVRASAREMLKRKSL